MPVPLTLTLLAAAVILLFVNDIAAAAAAVIAVVNQAMVEVALVRASAPIVEEVPE